MKRGIGLILFVLFLSLPVGVFADQGALVVVSGVKKIMSSDTTRITGNLYFETTSLVSAEVAGKAEEVFFKEGDKVKKGDKLVKIDTVLLEKELSLQESQLAQLNIRIEKAKKDFMRYEELFQQNATSESSYDDLKFNYQAMMEEKAALLKTMDITKIKLEKSIVYSPFAGIILAKSVEKGSWVQPGAFVYKIGALDSVSVKVPVSEKFIKYSKTGDIFNVELTALNKSLKGKFTGFIPYADPKTRNIHLKLALSYNGPLVENMTAVVDVPSSYKKEVFLVLRDSLVSGPQGDIVYTITDNKSKPVSIKIVGFDGKFAQVKSKELKDGMQIIAEGNERLQPDQAVKIVGEK